MKRLTTLLAVSRGFACMSFLFVLASAADASIRFYMEMADTIVVAQVESYESRAFQYGYHDAQARRALGDFFSTYPGHVIGLKTLEVIKGSAPATFTVAAMQDADGDLVDVLPVGSTAIFMLQRRSAEGYFHDKGYRNTEIAITWWETEGPEFAPGGGRAHGENVRPVEARELVTVGSVGSRMLQWFLPAAVSDSLEGRISQGMVASLAHRWIDPDQGQKPSEGEGPVEMRERVAQTLTDPRWDTDEVKRLQALSLALTWDLSDREADFVRGYRAVGKKRLDGPFPPLSAEANLALLDVFEPDHARALFVAFRYHVEHRDRLARVALTRFGEDRMLDAGILECVASLFDRSDLYPWGPDNSVEKDLSAKVAKARDLLHRHLSTVTVPG